jgi:kynureninase
LRVKAMALGELIVDLADEWLAGQGFRLASPRDPSRRGGHVCLAHPDAWRICRALAARGVICDYRVPDRLRIGPAPLYTRFTDVWDGMRQLAETVAAGEHEPLSREPARIT